jgi:hypothetical protein
MTPVLMEGECAGAQGRERPGRVGNGPAAGVGTARAPVRPGPSLQVWPALRTKDTNQEADAQQKIADLVAFLEGVQK